MNIHKEIEKSQQRIWKWRKIDMIMLSIVSIIFIIFFIIWRDWLSILFVGFFIGQLFRMWLEGISLKHLQKMEKFWREYSDHWRTSYYKLIDSIKEEQKCRGKPKKKQLKKKKK